MIPLRAETELQHYHEWLCELLCALVMLCAQMPQGWGASGY